MLVATYVFFAVLGLVAGAAIVWVLIAAHPFETPEEPWLPPDPVEAAFIADEMTRRGRAVDEQTAAEILNLHLDYLEGRARANQAEAAREQFETERETIRDERKAEAGASAGENVEATERDAASPETAGETVRR